MGFGPQFADLDGDGIRDVISGSDGSGGIFLFRGERDGGFAPRERLMRADGVMTGMFGGSTVSVADWDGDGVLDLVVGDRPGKVWLMRGDGVRNGRPEFDLARPFELDETEPTPHVDAAPLVVDWDRDGVADLLVAYGMGNVVFYRGVIEEGAHTLELGRVLLQPAYAQEPEEVVRSEVSGKLEPVVERSHKLPKLAVFDWNGDGKPDLLVGDSFGAVGPAPPLDARDFQRLQELRKQQSEVSELYLFARRPLWAKVEQEFGTRQKPRGDANAWQELTDERMEQLDAADETCRMLARKLEGINAERAKLDAPVIRRGYVWVYLRK